MIDYNNTIALVTGAASGIGAALAQALAARGAQVLCADINAEGLEKTVHLIGNGEKAMACYLSNPNAAEQLIQDVFRQTGRLDLVCSNAGIGYASKLAKTDFTHQRIEKLFEINLFAGLKLGKAYSERLASSGTRGRLMVTASETSLSVPSAVRNNDLALYSASKHALLTAMEWFRIEQAEGPLDLHVLMPGAVYTPLITRGLPDPAQAPPDLGLIQPERCAEIALKAMDLDLSYIPTHAHIGDDMRPRLQGVQHALQGLGLKTT